MDPLADKYPGWSPYNYCYNNPLRLLDKTGKGPGEGIIEYEIQNTFEVMWADATNAISDYYNNDVPEILDYVALVTAIPAPAVSAAAGAYSALITVTNDLSDGKPSMDTFESVTTAVVGASKNKAVGEAAAVIQVTYDGLKEDAKKNENAKKNDQDKKEKQKQRDETTVKAIKDIEKKKESDKNDSSLNLVSCHKKDQK